MKKNLLRFGLLSLLLVFAFIAKAQDVTAIWDFQHNVPEGINTATNFQGKVGDITSTVDGYREQGHFRMIDQGENNDLSCLRGDSILDSFAEREMIRNQVLDDVQKLMMYLPANQREVVYMRYYQQMSFKEIAETTNVSINTSLGRMRYALLNLRRMAKEHHICLQLD